MPEEPPRHYPVPPGGWRHRIDEEVFGTDRAGRVMMRLRDLSSAVEALRSRYAVVSGIHPTDLRALSVLGHDHEEPLTMGELARQLDLTTGAVTGLVDRLEQAGYVERLADREDRRRVRLRTTASADAVAASFLAELATQLRSVCEGLDDRELAAVERFLEAIIPVIAEHGGRPAGDH